MEEPKFCVDCVYCEFNQKLPAHSLCSCPAIRSRSDQYYVTGLTFKPRCVDCRMADIEGACGHDAIHFKAKENQ